MEVITPVQQPLEWSDVNFSGIDCGIIDHDSRFVLITEVPKVIENPWYNSQFPERDEKEIQTDADEKVEFKPIQDTSPALVHFLRTVTPYVEAQLDKNVYSKAFNNYEPVWEDEIHTIGITAELMPYPDFSPATSQVAATSVSWNSNGTLIAVSYGHIDHEGWCIHSGSLCIWNIFSRKMNPKKPYISVDTQTCLVTAEFHSTEPNLIAGGTFNGQLHVWDLNKPDEPLLASSPLIDEAHLESITTVVWGKSPSRKQHRIITVGTEGKVILWDLYQKVDHSWKLEINKQFLLALKTRAKILIPTGGTSMSFSNEDDTTFVIGSESGRVFKCSTSVTGKEAAINPILFTFDPHAGPVYSVDYSPYHRNLFLSAGCDTHIRVFNVLKKTAIIDLVPSSSYLFSVQWCPFRPLLFAAASGDGKVYFYDLKKSKFKPAVVLDVAVGNAKGSVQTCKFNPKQKDYFATGDSHGVVKVWQLNHLLTAEQPSERAILDKLGGSKETKATGGPAEKSEETTENE